MAINFKTINIITMKNIPIDAMRYVYRDGNRNLLDLHVTLSSPRDTYIQSLCMNQHRQSSLNNPAYMFYASDLHKKILRTYLVTKD